MNTNVVTIKSQNEYKDVEYEILDKTIDKTWHNQQIGFKVKIIESKLMKSTKIDCLSLMAKYLSEIMHMMN